MALLDARSFLLCGPLPDHEQGNIAGCRLLLTPASGGAPRIFRIDDSQLPVSVYAAARHESNPPRQELLRLLDGGMSPSTQQLTALAEYRTPGLYVPQGWYSRRAGAGSWSKHGLHELIKEQGNLEAAPLWDLVAPMFPFPGNNKLASLLSYEMPESCSQLAFTVPRVDSVKAMKCYKTMDTIAASATPRLQFVQEDPSPRRMPIPSIPGDRVIMPPDAPLGLPLTMPALPYALPPYRGAPSSSASILFPDGFLRPSFNLPQPSIFPGFPSLRLSELPGKVDYQDPMDYVVDGAAVGWPSADPPVAADWDPMPVSALEPWMLPLPTAAEADDEQDSSPRSSNGSDDGSDRPARRSSH